MTSIATPHPGLPADSDAGYGEAPRHRRHLRSFGREEGRVWWRPSEQQREDRPSLRERMVPSFPAESRWVSWGFPLLVMLFGGYMRLRHLWRPKSVVFDETYYAKDAWAVIHFGHERAWQVVGDQGMAQDDKAIIADPHLWRSLLNTGQLDNAVHPPVGKWMIGIGESIFGFNPEGWRFSAAVCGTLAILMIARIARRLFRSTLIGFLAGLLMAVDGMELVMSRIALLDIFVMFWTLAAFGCLLVDRDWMRSRLVTWRESQPATPLPNDTRGPKLGWRPWRIAAAICLGLDMGTKWSGLAIIFVFFAMALLWDHAAFRAVGIRKHWVTFWRRSFWQTAVAGVLALATYVASWTGWFLTKDGNFRQWTLHHNYSPGDPRWTGPVTHTWYPAVIRDFWEWHMWSFSFSTHLTSKNSPHPYMSNPWSWPIMGRPTNFYYQGTDSGKSGCTAARGCSAQILDLGTPTLWWLATIALFYCLWRWLGRRDWRAGAILAGMLGAWAFWLQYSYRTIFTFYAVAFEPFMVLAAAFLLGAILGRSTASPTRRQFGAIGAGAITVIVMITFIYFFPLYTAGMLSYDSWTSHIWWDSWW